MQLPQGQYGALLIDPPWHFKVRSPKGEGRSASQHYKCLGVEQIAALPVQSIAARDCVLFLWATDPMLPAALEVICAWGFTYKTVAFTWVKTNSVSPGFSTGMGFWTRSNPEQCLLATRGHPKRKAKDVRQLVVTARREHSRKPDEVRTRIERLVEGPYLELFARQSIPGWTTVGDQSTMFDTVDEAPATNNRQIDLINYIEGITAEAAPDLDGK
jgi:N6-adenosine-specific RNA methylase IME4